MPGIVLDILEEKGNLVLSRYLSNFKFPVDTFAHPLEHSLPGKQANKIAESR